MKEKYKIEKNIPIPKKKFSQFPIDKMEIGDSFLAHDEKDRKKQATIATGLRNWINRKKNNWKFTVRQVDEGIRVWRIE